MNRLRAAEFCWERGGAQVGRRADGSSGGMGWAPRAMRWALWGGGEAVNGFGGDEGLLAECFGFAALCGVED